jgi:cell division protein FtsW (lipid II flippase)
MTAGGKPRKPAAKRGRKGRATGPVLGAATAVAGAVICGFGMLAVVRLANAPVMDASLAWELLPLGVFVAAVLFTAIMRFSRADAASLRLMLPVILLAGLGMVAQVRMGASLAPDSATRSLLAYPLGVGVMLIISFAAAGGRYELLARLQWVLWLVAVAVIAALLVLGTRFRGALFAAGGMTPTELIKPLLVLFLAARLAPAKGRKGKGRGKGRRKGKGLAGVPGLATTLIAMAIPMGLLVLQRDLGMVAMLGATTVLMLYAARGEVRWLVLGGVTALLLGLGMALLASHGQQRLMAWADPFASPTGRGWQPLQALSALYAGGFWGTGLGQGAPSLIPVASSDFIYAALAEELGFLGSILIVGCFLLIFREGLQRGESEKDPFGRLAAMGLTCMLAVQALLNMGGVTKALPLTGVPLPFISHGGSSLAVSFAMIGLVIAIGSPRTSRRKK